MLVRHGESTWNQSGRIQGQDDTARLTAQGRLQAREAATQLTALDVGVIISSDLHRSVETARIIAEILKLEMRTTPMLRERNLGVLEGLPAVNLIPALSGIANGDVLNVHARPAEGESIDDLFRRTAAFVEELVAEGVTAPCSSPTVDRSARSLPTAVALPWRRRPGTKSTTRASGPSMLVRSDTE